MKTRVRGWRHQSSPWLVPFTIVYLYHLYWKAHCIASWTASVLCRSSKVSQRLVRRREQTWGLYRGSWRRVERSAPGFGRSSPTLRLSFTPLWRSKRHCTMHAGSHKGQTYHWRKNWKRVIFWKCMAKLNDLFVRGGTHKTYINIIFIEIPSPFFCVWVWEFSCICVPQDNSNSSAFSWGGVKETCALKLV